MNAHEAVYQAVQASKQREELKQRTLKDFQRKTALRASAHRVKLPQQSKPVTTVRVCALPYLLPNYSTSSFVTPKIYEGSIVSCR